MKCVGGCGAKLTGRNMRVHFAICAKRTTASGDVERRLGIFQYHQQTQTAEGGARRLSADSHSDSADGRARQVACTHTPGRSPPIDLGPRQREENAASVQTSRKME